MNQIKNLQIKIFKKALGLAVILGIASLFIKNLNITAGIIAGFFIGVLHFKMISSSAKRLIGFKKANWIMIFSAFGVFLRFLILGILFWLAIIKGNYFFAGTVIGFFTIKASIVIDCINKRLLWKV